MRRISKFKFSNKNHNYPFFFFKRVLRFKRPKWNYIKIKNLKLIKNQILITKKLNFKNKVKLFKNILFLKKKFKQNFLYSNFFFYFLKNIKNLLKKKHIIFLKSKLKKLRKKPKSFRKSQIKFILNNFFFNFVRVTSKISSWNRLRFNFKATLWMKFSVLKYFNSCFSITFFKRLNNKTKNRTHNLSLFFIKPDYRLDLLLWRLKFFISPYLVRNAVRLSLITVSSKINDYDSRSVRYNYFVHAGDLIRINSNKFKFKIILSHFVKSFYLPSFIEIDYYLNTIIILKNYNVLNTIDLNSIIKEPLCLYKFKNFIFK